MAAKALGMLPHVAAFWAGFWRGQQVGKAAFLATQWRLETKGRVWQVRGHLEGHHSPALCPQPRTFSRWLWPLGPGLRPRSPSPEPSGEEPTAWQKWEMRGRGNIPQSKGQGFRFKSGLLTSHEIEGKLIPLLEPQLFFFSICQLELIPSHPLGYWEREQRPRRLGSTRC